MRIQAFLFFGVAAVAFYFTVRLAFAFLYYWPLQAEANGQVSRWEIKEVGDRFKIAADYSFGVQEKTLTSHYTYLKNYFNEALALADLKEKAKQPLSVWYNSRSPEFSVLERDFPASLLVRTLLCYGVVVYFFLLNKKIRSVDI